MNLRNGIAMLGLLALLCMASAAESQVAHLEPYRGQTITEIRIAGNRVTREFVIRREIWSEEGAPLDPGLVAQDLTRLENLALFGSVVVTPIPMDEGVALDFEFTEMPWLIPFPAVKWNEQNGFSFGLGVSSPNFLGYGATLSLNAVFGGTTTVSFRGAHPWISGDHFSIELLAYHSERRNTLLEFDEKSDRVEAILGYHIGRFGRLGGNIGYWGVASDQDGITLHPGNRDDMFLAGLSVGYDSRDSWRVPHRGWRGTLSSEVLLGDADTRTISLDVTRYQPIVDRHTLAFGPLISYREGKVGEQIPSYDQYFLGGSNSVRGFKLEELGKKIFGKNRLLASAEYRYLALPVRPFGIFRWSVAIGAELATFADIGVIWNEPEQFAMSRTRFGYGAGVRVLFPVVDMIRFDVGVSEFGDVVFNFGIRSIFDARSLRTF
jgi:outer membrane protein insertion porin family